MHYKRIFFALFLFFVLSLSACVQKPVEEKPKITTEEPVEPVVEQPSPKPQPVPEEKQVEEQPVVERPIEAPAEEKQLLSQGLLIHYDFEPENETKFKFLDASNNGFDATKINFFETATIQSFNNSRAASFTGRNDYLEVDNTNFRTDLVSFTVSVWVNVSDLSEIRNIFSSLRGHGQYPELNILHNGSVAFFPIILSDATRNFSTKERVIEAGKWHHIALVFDGEKENTATVFVDGAQKAGRVLGKGHVNTGANNMWIGRGRVAVVNFSGAMDEFKLYNRALSAEEIEQLYSSTTKLQKEQQSLLTPFFALYQSIIEFFFK